MLAAAKMTLGILGPGLLLGTLGAALVKPVPKEPPAPPWQLGGQPEIAVSEAKLWFEAGPEDLNPGGYRPDLDYDAEVTNYWIDRFEEYSSSEYDNQPLASLPEIAEDDRTGAPFTVAEPSAEVAAMAAEDVADAALEAQSVTGPEAPADASGKSELAQAGLW